MEREKCAADIRLVAEAGRILVAASWPHVPDGGGGWPGCISLYLLGNWMEEEKESIGGILSSLVTAMHVGIGYDVADCPAAAGTAAETEYGRSAV